MLRWQRNWGCEGVRNALEAAEKGKEDTYPHFNPSGVKAWRGKVLTSLSLKDCRGSSVLQIEEESKVKI